MTSRPQIPGAVPGRVERVAETLRTILRHHTRAGAA